MKTPIATPTFWLTLVLSAAGLRAQEAAAPAAPGSSAPEAAAAPSRSPTPPGMLRFNFRGAPLETVLNYMSEAAGFIIVTDGPVRGTVDMWSAQPVTSEEAVQLLNFALNKNGYAATVRGRNLIVSSKDDAKKTNVPIRTGNDPHEIPDNAELVMQIIPLRRIDATQASRDLAALLPGSATLTANQDSNSLIVTDTNSNIRHIVELVAALDTSSDTVSTLRVFKLKNADPQETAQLLTSLFATTSTGRPGGGFTPGSFGGGGFGGGLPPGAIAAMAAAAGGGRTSRTGGSQTARVTPVMAVADPRTSSVIVTASKESMTGIAEIIEQLDATSARKQKVFVYTMENADVKQVESVLKSLFQSANQRSSTTNQVDPLSSRAASNTQSSAANLSLGTSRGGP